MKKIIIKIIVFFMTQPVFAAASVEPLAEERIYNPEKTAKLQEYVDEINDTTWPGNRQKMMQLVCEGADSRLKRHWDSEWFFDLAIFRDDYEVSECLLKYSADPNTKNMEGETTLFRARSLNMVRLLLGYKANVDCEGRKGGNLLHSAATQDRAPELFVELCNLGVDPRKRDISDVTPLHNLFLMSRWRENIEKKSAVLVWAGADLYCKNERGQTPLDLLQKKRPELVAPVLAFHKSLPERKVAQKRKWQNEVAPFLQESQDPAGIVIDYYGELPISLKDLE
jgi:hypothetical protein